LENVPFRAGFELLTDDPLQDIPGIGNLGIGVHDQVDFPAAGFEVGDQQAPALNEDYSLPVSCRRQPMHSTRAAYGSASKRVRLEIFVPLC
jgi:hypothetical protein